MSEENEQESSGAGKKKGGTVLAVVAAVVTAAGGAFAGTTFVGPRLGEVMAADASQTAGEGESKKKDDHGGDYDDHGGSGGGEIEVHMIDNLIVNPAGSGASRFLLASIAILPGGSADVEDLAARDIELRDALLRLLGSKSVDDLADIGQRTALTDEMKAVLAVLLGEGQVERIFLPQWVIQ